MAAVSGEMEDLRAIARVRQIDLRAATLECDELRVQVGKLTQSNTRVRAVNTALLVSKGKWDDQLQRLHELEDQALDMQRCKSDLQDSLKRAHEAEAASVKERDNSLALLDAADARIGELHERVAELEQQTGLAYVGVPSTPAPEPGGFVVSAMAAQRIAQLVGQLTRTSAAMPPNNQHSLELGLASALDAQQDINSAMAVLTGALAPFYVPEKREDGCSDWGALLAACFGDVVFADGLLSKAWTATVQCLHQLTDTGGHTTDATDFPISLKAGYLLSYVRTHIPALAEDVRSARAAAYPPAHEATAAPGGEATAAPGGEATAAPGGVGP